MGGDGIGAGKAGGGIRAFNERVILSLIRRNGPMSKAEIGRAAGLSAQAAMVIVNGLLADKLLVKRPKVRGGVGQPSTPVALHPDGAFSLGVKIGRRSVETVLVNMEGKVVLQRHAAIAAPLRTEAMDLATEDALVIVEEMPPALRWRIVGLGLALPGDLHAWAGDLGLAAGALDDWRAPDPALELERRTGIGVTLYNDATAACAAEMLAGVALSKPNALYVYVGTFVGGGVVIGGQLHRGGRDNAGAIGSMPMPGDTDPPPQLIHRASALHLEQRLAAAGLDARAIIGGQVRAPAKAEAIFADWAAGAVEALARAVVCAMSVVDFEAVVIDGILRADWRRRITHGVRQALARFDARGLSPVEIATGSIGPGARALGAALMPLHERFSPQPALMVRQTGALPGPGGDEDEEWVWSG